jgi:FixJ family two-component response regulator
LAHRDIDAPACLGLDARLPELSGLDLQQELARIDNTIPVVFIMGHGDLPMSVETVKGDRRYLQSNRW